MSSTLQQVNTLIKSLGRDTRLGLKLMVKLADHDIGVNRDWDASAALLKLANDMPDKKVGAAIAYTFKLVLRARFGDRLVLETDKSAKHGRKFTMKWDHNETVIPTNTWSIVTSYANAGVGFADKNLLKDLRESMLFDTNKKAYDAEAAAKRLVKKLEAEGIPLSLMIAAMQAEAKKLAPTTQVAQLPKDAVIIELDDVAA